MDVVIPPEFEAVARDQVKAGVFASEEEAVTAVLRHYAAHVAELRALLDPAVAEADRGEGMDGGLFMRELIEDTRTRFGG